MNWMEIRDFFNTNGLGLPRENVYFENTRQDKLNRISILNCTYFVDDLEETFLESSFPAKTNRYLYSPQGTTIPIPGVKIARSWLQLSAEILDPAREGLSS